MKKYISLAILVSLLSGKRLTAPFLAKKYETSIKTIYRSIDTLLEAGMPIVSIKGSGGGYELLSSQEISKSFFTTKELAYFLSFLKTSKQNNILEDEFNIEDRLNLLNKEFINEIDKKSNQIVIDTELWGSISQNNKAHGIITDAVKNQMQVRIIYASNENVWRVIEPYTLVYKTGVWYVYAFCHLRKAFRLFRLSRITNIEITNVPFTRKEIDVSKKPWNEEFKHNNEVIKIKLKCSKLDEDLTSWIENVNMFCQGENKIITGNAVFSSGLIHRIMQLGTSVKVLEPKKLKDAVYNECMAILSNIN